jgi:hypothetical protein
MVVFIALDIFSLSDIQINCSIYKTLDTIFSLQSGAIKENLHE